MSSSLYYNNFVRQYKDIRPVNPQHFRSPDSPLRGMGNVVGATLVVARRRSRAPLLKGAVASGDWGIRHPEELLRRRIKPLVPSTAGCTLRVIANQCRSTGVAIRPSRRVHRPAYCPGSAGAHAGWDSPKPSPRSRGDSRIARRSLPARCDPAFCPGFVGTHAARDSLAFCFPLRGTGKQN